MAFVFPYPAVVKTPSQFQMTVTKTFLPASLTSSDALSFKLDPKRYGNGVKTTSSSG